ncbi:EF-hand domain-containing protein [Sphingomonas sp.]|uniref:EF-hand domain-containing protein n=1 Tax=Sphingomonas sp. TaxID=28214 RepID=UPI003D6D0A5C
MRKKLLTCLTLLTTTMIIAPLSAQDAPPPGARPPGAPPPGAPDTRPPGMAGDHPRGRLFISPMGEPFRGDKPVDTWFDGADTNHDGALDLAEFTHDEQRFFAVLDRSHDGEIDPDDIENYETAIAPEIRVRDAGGGGGGARRGGGGGGGGHRGGGGGGGGRHGGGGMRGGGGGGDGGGASSGSGEARVTYGKQGAARFSYFDFPEPVTIADTNFNRGVDPREFDTAARQRFAQLDKNGDGKLEKSELPRITFGRGEQGGNRGGERGEHRGDRRWNGQGGNRGGGQYGGTDPAGTTPPPEE